MKKTFIAISLFVTLMLAGLSIASAQEQPKGQKDTVNMDTYAKPEHYYAVEDEKGGSKSKTGLTIGIAAGAVAVLGVAGFFLLRKKKK
jgi:LPXTG-motif cell wall-anchored protein